MDNLTKPIKKSIKSNLKTQKYGNWQKEEDIISCESDKSISSVEKESEEYENHSYAKWNNDSNSHWTLTTESDWSSTQDSGKSESKVNEKIKKREQKYYSKLNEFAIQNDTPDENIERLAEATTKFFSCIF